MSVVECFTLTAQSGGARAGLLHTGHGVVRTPVFMPVGTKATVKAVHPDELEQLRAQVILGNTYHLSLRPGTGAVRDAGGLHKLMHWRGPILTDSGGYQVFSLRHLGALDDDGVTFQSVYDGSAVRFTPEGVVQAQADLGSDIAMVLDQCPPGDADRDVVAQAVERTALWARRARTAHLAARDERPAGWPASGVPQLQFGIVQGGVFDDLRARSAEQLLEIGFDGYAVGGLSVGEPQETTMPTLERTTALLPRRAARYFMGIGDPVGVLDVIARGIDMFDCVLPTRLGRTASAIVPATDHAPNGRLNLRNARHAEADVPLDDGCSCPACSRGFTRRYVRHLLQQDEILGLRVLTLHNLHVMLDLVARARRAITQDRWPAFYASERQRWAPIVARGDTRRAPASDTVKA